MALPPTDAPHIGWDWDIVQDADFNDALPPLVYDDIVPINLTGCTIQLFIRPTRDFATPIAVVASPTNITIDDAAAGLVTVYVPQATVEAWEVGEWEFFMRVTDGTGKIAEVARGPFLIHPGKDSTS